MTHRFRGLREEFEKIIYSPTLMTDKDTISTADDHNFSTDPL